MGTATVISLSTIPSRFGAIGPTLDSLLRQSSEIEEIRLVVPRQYRRFPDYDGAAPSVPDGVTVVRPEQDLGPATKVLYTARDLRGTDRRILFCDDDRTYPRDWAARLLAAAGQRPDHAICVSGWTVEKVGVTKAQPNPDPPPRRARKSFGYRLRRLGQHLRSPVAAKRIKPAWKAYDVSGQVDVLHGFAGCLVRPDWFDDAAFEIPERLWTVDDVWLSGHLARKGVPIWVEAGLELPPANRADRIEDLLTATIDGVDRDGANRACVDYMRATYGVWR